MGRLELGGMANPSKAEEFIPENSPPENALLEASMNQARMAAIGGLLHDMVNSMMGIHSLSESLVRSLEKDNPLKSNIELIYKSALKAQKLMLRISEVNRSKPGERTLVDLAKLVHSQKEILKVVLPPGAALQLDIMESELPVRIDVNSFKMVLLHFAMNATCNLAAQCRVKLSVRAVCGGDATRKGVFPQSYGLPHDAVEVSFSDAGGGISPAILPRVFDPFFTTREKWGGMGLGLFFAQNFAETHNGQLGILNEEGTGTTFLLLLPLEDLEEC